MCIIDFLEIIQSEVERVWKKINLLMLLENEREGSQDRIYEIVKGCGQLHHGPWRKLLR